MLNLLASSLASQLPQVLGEFADFVGNIISCRNFILNLLASQLPQVLGWFADFWAMSFPVEILC
ncbi:hypothetical protein [Pseudomonas sp. NPDC087817]|uniref:hypothetical protein n=1 Tax=Pseudomonas sp. NPDC087817 TaxID=3364451 RepID=UPI003812EE8B